MHGKKTVYFHYDNGQFELLLRAIQNSTRDRVKYEYGEHFLCNTVVCQVYHRVVFEKFFCHVSKDH